MLFSLLVIPSPPSGIHRSGVVIEKLLFSSVKLKMELVASKLVTANSQFHSSGRLIGMKNEKTSICLFSLNSSVSCGFVFVCSISVSVCFYIRSNNSFSSFEYFKFFGCYIFNEFFLILGKVFFCFLGFEAVSRLEDFISIKYFRFANCQLW